jgi:hypothetical protein
MTGGGWAERSLNGDDSDAENLWILQQDEDEDDDEVWDDVDDDWEDDEDDDWDDEDDEWDDDEEEDRHLRRPSDDDWI